jgi:Rrf2 family protein
VEIAKNGHNGPIKLKDIVENQEISDSYLVNILLTLQKAGLITSIRGLNGGHSLRKPASEITLLEVVNSLEGSLTSVPCIDTPTECERRNFCSMSVIWKKLKLAEEEVLRSITIRQLVENEKSTYMPDYFI